MKADGLLAEDTNVRSSKYLNNLIEQDHRNIKSRTNVVLGFKRFRSAATTIAGIELMHRIRRRSSTSPFPGSKMPLRLPSGMLSCSIAKVSINIGNFSAAPSICTRTAQRVFRRPECYPVCVNATQPKCIEYSMWSDAVPQVQYELDVPTLRIFDIP